MAAVAAAATASVTTAYAAIATSAKLPPLTADRCAVKSPLMVDCTTLLLKTTMPLSLATSTGRPPLSRTAVSCTGTAVSCTGTATRMYRLSPGAVMVAVALHTWIEGKESMTTSIGIKLCLQK